jgi:hypothetical protein
VSHIIECIRSCHLGKTILYDTVSKLGWSVDPRTHGIAVIVERLLAQHWEGGVPEPVEESDCVVRLCPQLPKYLADTTIGFIGLFCLGVWEFPQLIIADMSQITGRARERTRCASQRVLIENNIFPQPLHHRITI